MRGSIQLISPFAVVAAALLVFLTVENSRAATSPTTAEAPVEFTFGGIAPDKAAPIDFSIGGATSPAGVTVAVQ